MTEWEHGQKLVDDSYYAGRDDGIAAGRKDLDKLLGAAKHVLEQWENVHRQHGWRDLADAIWHLSVVVGELDPGYEP